MKPRVPVRVHGRGAVEIPGYGLADAEHRLEKELKSLLPGGTVQVQQIRRTDPEPRIVESYLISFSVVTDLEVEPSDEGKVERAAYAAARERVRSSRFERVEWVKAVTLG